MQKITNIILFAALVAIAAGLFYRHPTDAKNEPAEFPVKTEKIVVVPGAAIGDSGWQNVNAVFAHDTPELSGIDRFNRQNSAYFDDFTAEIKDSGVQPKNIPQNETVPADGRAASTDTDNSETPPEGGNGQGGEMPGKDEPENAPPENPAPELETGKNWYISVRALAVITDGATSSAESLLPPENSNSNGQENDNKLSPEPPDGEVQEKHLAPETSEADKYSDDEKQEGRPTPEEPINIETAAPTDETAPSPPAFPNPLPSGPGLELSKFEIGEAMNEFKVAGAQLRFSFAATKPAAGGAKSNEFVVFYSLAGSDWQSLSSIALDAEISDAANGGYFLASLPQISKMGDIQNLKIKFVFGSNNQNSGQTVYLDAAWIEAEYELPLTPKELSREMHEKIKEKFFRLGETPEFVFDNLKDKKNFFEKILAWFSADKRQVTARLTNPRGEEIAANITVNGEKIQIAGVERSKFRPGKYTLSVIVKDGDENIEEIQEFKWGVLAVNTDKSVYKAGDTANIYMGALGEFGHTVCDAKMILEITDPDGAKEYPEVFPGGDCGMDNITDKPDYSARYQTGKNGTYSIYLTAAVGDSVMEIYDSFEVRGLVDFDVLRNGPTRINPKADYQMNLAITPSNDFYGQLAELVPADFNIIETGADIDATSTVAEIDGRKQIIWEAQMQAGHTYNFHYIFKAPPLSPYIFLLGPLQIGDFAEMRQWQIASDATITSTSSGGAWATGGTWVGGVAPSSTDVAVIATTGGNAVTMGATATCAGLTVNSGAKLNFNASTYNLTVNGNVDNSGTITVTNASGANTHTLSVTGNFTSSGTFDQKSAVDDILNLTISSTGTQSIGGFTSTSLGGTGSPVITMTKTAGTATVTGNITAFGLTLNGNGGTLNMGTGLTHTFNGKVTLTNGTLNGGSSTINVTTVSTTAWTGTGSKFTANASTVNFGAAGDQTIATATTFYNLTTSGSGTKTVGANTTVGGYLTVGDGTTMSIGAYTTAVTGATTVGSGTSGQLNITSTTGTKTFTGLVTVSSGATWNNSGNEAVTLQGGLTNAGTFTAGSGVYTFDTNSQTITCTAAISIPSITVTGVTATHNCSATYPLTVSTALSGTGTIKSGASSYLSLGGTSGISAWDNTTNDASTVDFAGSDSQTIPAVNFYHLTSSSSGARVLASSGTIGIAGTFTPGSNTYTITDSTIDFNGSGSQTIPAFDYNNLTSSSTGGRTLASSGTVGIAGTFTPGSNTYTITGSTVEFNGSSQTIPAFNYNNLTSSSSGGSSYSYRTKIPITYTTAGAQTGYTKQITLVKGTGTNSSGTIYLNNHCESWPYDISFKNAAGDDLDFYREESDATDGTWHVELDSIADSGDTDFYVYYGKSSDTDASSGANTFVVFEDGEDNSLSDWTSAGDAWTIDPGYKETGNYGLRGESSDSDTVSYLTKSVSLNSFFAHGRFKVSGLTYNTACLMRAVANTSGTIGAYYFGMTSDGHLNYWNGTAQVNLPTDTVISSDTWYTLEAAADLSNSLWRFWVGGSSKGTATLKDSGNATLTSSNSFSEIQVRADWWDAGVNVYFDNYWVRKYAYPEPAWASPGSETELSVSRILASSGTIGIAGTFTPGTAAYTVTGSTVDYNGAAQDIGAITYNNLTFSNSGNKTCAAAITVNANLSLSGTAKAALAAGTNSTANALYFSGVLQRVGTHGSTSSSASYQNDTWFASSTGYVTVATGVTENAAAAFSAAPHEDPLSDDATPTNVATNVIIKATATDAESDQWYLAVCKTNEVATTTNAAPTCPGGAWDVSDATNSGSEATASYTVQSGDTLESYAWYGFACDKTSDSPKCSSMSNSGTSGNNGSPFAVNHRPTFTAVSDDGPKDPGAADLTITADTYDDDDTGGSQDTVSMYVCKSNDFTGTACGAGGTWCSQTGVTPGNTLACDLTIPNPQAHGSVSYYPYIIDSHNLAATGGKQSSAETFTVNDVAPAVSGTPTLNNASAISLTEEKSTTDIYVRGIVTDDNGCADATASTTADVWQTDLVGRSGCTAGSGGDFAYRAKIPVTYTTAGSQTNYAKQITLVKGSGANSAGTVYLNDHAENWPYDIRFKNAAGDDLDFYREESDATDGTWHVELDSIAASGDTDFYVYYGSDSITDDTGGSSGNNTFAWFDDFETGNYSKWSNSQNTDGTLEVTNSVKFEGSYSLHMEDPNYSGVFLWNTMTMPTNFATKVRVLFTKTWNVGGSYIAYNGTATSGIGPLLKTSGSFKYWNGADYSDLPTSKTVSTFTWYTVEVAVDFTNDKIRYLYVKDGDAGVVDGIKNWSNQTETAATDVTLGTAYDNGEVYFDQLMVRKYAYPEPTWAAPDAEASVSGGDPSDPNNCYYHVTCAYDAAVDSCDGGNDKTAGFKCTVPFQYYANPTDANTPWADDDWTATLIPGDGQGANAAGEANTAAVEMNSFLALGLAEGYSAVSFGSMDADSHTDPLIESMRIEATGNCAANANVYGTAMVSGDYSIAASYQRYATGTTAPAWSAGTALSGSETLVNLDVCKSGYTATPEWKRLWWGIDVPAGQVGGSYSGTNTVVAVKKNWSTSHDWCE